MSKTHQNVGISFLVSAYMWCDAWKEIHDTWQKQQCTVALVIFSAIVIFISASLDIAGCGWVEVGGWWWRGGGPQPAELSLTWVRLPLLVLGSKVVCLLGVWGGSSTLHFVWLQGFCMGTSPRTQIETHRKAMLAIAAQPWFYCLLLVFLIHKAAASKWTKTLSKCWRSKSNQQSSCGVSLLRTLDWKRREWSDMHVLIQPGWKMCPCVIVIEILCDIIYKRV